MRRSMHQYLLERQQREETLNELDKTQWYCLVNDGTNYLSKDLCDKFFECHLDSGTQQFIDHCYDLSEGFFRTFFISLMRSILRLFISSTSICGLLNCGRMFVFSDEQINKFCFEQIFHNNRGGILLDIGAGDGSVTAKLDPYFDTVYVTELSSTMQNRLLSRGYRLLDANDWQNHSIEFDMISCLNVLDRCDKPLEMLSHIRKSLELSGGYLLLAIVLPFTQYVESKYNHRPEQYMPVDGQTFEQQVQSFWDNVLKPAGFELICWTKLPYLSEGDIDLTYFWLNDALFLLRTVIRPSHSVV